MAKKQKKIQVKHTPTRRQLASWQRQQQLQRMAMIAGGIFLAFVLIFIGLGYYNDQVRPLNRPLLKVNNAVFDAGYYVKALDLYTKGQKPEVVIFMTDMTATSIERNALISQGARDLGLAVSAEEIDGELKQQQLDNSQVLRDIIRADLLTSRLLNEYFGPNIPAAADQVQVKAMFLESEQVAREVAEKLRAGGDFSAQAKEFSVEPFTREKGGDLGWLPKGFGYVLLGDIGKSVEDIAFGLEGGALSKPTYDGSISKVGGYWLIEVVERDAKMGSHSRGILLGSRQEAEQIRSRLQKGEDFAALAREYSQDPGSKELDGDLGWVQKNIGNKVVVDAALALEPGVLSEPVPDSGVQTKGGYWLVSVLSKETGRKLDDDTLARLKRNAFEEWLEELRERSTIENYLDDDLREWAAARVVKSRGQRLQ